MANEEEIGFYKGAIYTLSKEREELLKMLNIVEQLIKNHVMSLQKLGVDITKEFNLGTQEQNIQSNNKNNINTTNPTNNNQTDSN